MLSNGTSGYSDYVYNQKFVDAVVNHPFKQWTEQSIIDYAMMNPPLFEPNTSQHYTHTDYVLLGSILSKIMQQPIDQLFSTGIIKKLNLTKTQFISTAVIPFPVLHSFSQNRSIYEESTFWSPSWTGSSGSVVSTISDLGIFAQAWMKGSLLTPASTNELRAPDTVGKGKNTKDVYFAMGFGFVNHWLIQNPNMNGYSGIFAVLPEKNIIFIAYNTLQESANSQSLGNFSMNLWEQLAPVLAPDYPVPYLKI
jgi:CubicO group peptidase (beta-lactamase class C family)